MRFFILAAWIVLAGVRPLRAQRPSLAPEARPVTVFTPSAALRSSLLYDQGEMATFSLSSLPAPGETRRADTSFVRHPVDPWLGFDKLQHFTFSFLWTLGSQYVLVNKLAWSEGHALPVASGTAAAVGLTKEFYDRHIGPTRYFSRRDLVADALGIALATGLILL